MTTEEYTNTFDPKVYFETYYDDPKKDEYYLIRLTDFFTKVVKDKATSMLEYGAGPTISRFITASKHLKSIIAAEYVKENRQAMEDWINQDPKAFNWRPTFEYVVQKLEGMTPDEVEKREAEVREKIKAVVYCDATSKAENHLEIPKEISAKYGPPFDVVTTSLTLEGVLDTFQEYKDQVSYLTGLLRPGGFLLLHGVLEQSFYTVGTSKYKTVHLTKEMVLESMKDAGLKDVVIDFATTHFGFKEFNQLPNADLKDFYVVYGQKL